MSKDCSLKIVIISKMSVIIKIIVTLTMCYYIKIVVIFTLFVELTLFLY